MSRTLSRNADVAVLAAAACAGLALLAAWAANGFTWSSSDKGGAGRRAAGNHSKPKPAARPAPVPADRPVPRRGVTLTLVAARGPAWVSIRSGSRAGRTLYEGMLRHRERLELSGPRLVARFQAAGNLQAWVGGRSADVRRYELRALSITKTGIRSLPVPVTRYDAPAVVAS